MTSEITDKYNEQYFWDRYTRKNKIGMQKGSKPYLYIYWLRNLRKLLPERSRILEVGCGNGFFLTKLNAYYYATGIDISKVALKSALEMCPSLPILQTNAEHMPLKKQQFSSVIAFDVVEHIKNPEKFFDEVNRVLVDEGIFIFSTPNPASVGARCKKKTASPTENTYDKRLLQWFGWRDDTHISIKHMDEWRELLVSNNFAILKDGTDTLWDVPYFKSIPSILQKSIILPLHWMLTYSFGFFSWTYGENYICIAKKRKL